MPHEKIEPVFADFRVAVENGNCRLALERNLLRDQFDCESLLMDFFKKARTKLAMHGNSGGNNSSSQIGIT